MRNLSKVLKAAWDAARAEMEEQRQEAEQARKKKRILYGKEKFEAKIGALEKAENFFVYDAAARHRSSDGITSEIIKEDTDGDKRYVFLFTVNRERVPQEGDRIRRTEDGKAGLYLIYDVEGASGASIPRARAILLEDNYKGGIGQGGAYDSEFSSDLFKGKLREPYKAPPESSVEVKRFTPMPWLV